MAAIGNEVTEKDIRDHLTANGYYGRSAEIRGLNLVAVQRPGWLQVFSFNLRARDVVGDWRELFGTCRDDESAGTLEVFLAPTPSQRDAQVAEWSEDLITLQRDQKPVLVVALMLLFVIAMGAALIGSISRNQQPVRSENTDASTSPPQVNRTAEADPEASGTKAER